MPKILDDIHDYNEDVQVNWENHRISFGIPGPSATGLALAINLIDLQEIESRLLEELFGHGLLLLDPTPIWIDRENMEETGSAFACPLLHAAAICDYLRECDRKGGKTPIRIYLRTVKAWTKLPGSAILIKYDRLNPAIFPPERAVVVQPNFPTRARKI